MDHSAIQRLEYLITQLGDYAIEEVTRAVWRVTLSGSPW
jgi:hypothetical protein